MPISRKSFRGVAAGIPRLVGVAMVAGGLAVSVSSVALASPGNADNVTFCHRTDSATNPYVVVTTDPEAIIREGHDTHEGPVFSPELKDAHTTWGDIIPAFTFVNGRGETQSYPGMNLPDGQSILDHGCTVPAETTTSTTSVPTTSTTTSTTSVPTTSTTTSTTSVPTTSTTSTTSTTTAPTGVVTSPSTPGGPGHNPPPAPGGGNGGGPAGGAPAAVPALGSSPQPAGEAANQGELAFTGPANGKLGVVGLLLILTGAGLIALRVRLVRRPAPAHR